MPPLPLPLLPLPEPAELVCGALVGEAVRLARGEWVASAVGMSEDDVDDPLGDESREPLSPGCSTRPTDVPDCPVNVEPFAHSIPVTTRMPTTNTTTVMPAHSHHFAGLRGTTGAITGAITTVSASAGSVAPVWRRVWITRRTRSCVRSSDRW